MTKQSLLFVMYIVKGKTHSLISNKERPNRMYTNYKHNLKDKLYNNHKRIFLKCGNYVLCNYLNLLFKTFIWIIFVVLSRKNDCMELLIASALLYGLWVCKESKVIMFITKTTPVVFISGIILLIGFLTFIHVNQFSLIN